VVRPPEDRRHVVLDAVAEAVQAVLTVGQFGDDLRQRRVGRRERASGHHGDVQRGPTAPVVDLLNRSRFGVDARPADALNQVLASFLTSQQMSGAGSPEPADRHNKRIYREGLESANSGLRSSRAVANSLNGTCRNCMNSPSMRAKS
jgi:hypothetical protein